MEAIVDALSPVTTSDIDQFSLWTTQCILCFRACDLKCLLVCIRRLHMYCVICALMENLLNRCSFFVRFEQKSLFHCGPNIGLLSSSSWAKTILF
jgi:hypothetical protein